MNDKKTRYVITIFTLDKLHQSIGLTTWDKERCYEFFKEQEKRYGLKLISSKEEVLIVVEYNNIIWEYMIYYGSYKKRYKTLESNDERKIQIEKRLLADLKTIGLEELKEDILKHLETGTRFEYKIKLDTQFKNYCV
ncbi:MAG: hypothetical protein IJN03_01145 [Bacilli bacterium]|nr:hypothetical protein [Bacilli bacterium]